MNANVTGRGMAGEYAEFLWHARGRTARWRPTLAVEAPEAGSRVPFRGDNPVSAR